MNKGQKPPIGTVLYNGPSLLDGNPVVCIATLGSNQNPKIGDMVQTWILRRDIDPVSAVKSGQDYSICGDCAHRGTQGNRAPDNLRKRSCYVLVYHAPLAIWKAYQRGRYAPVDVMGWESFSGRCIRFGSYGDPAAIPTKVWETLAEFGESFTGYTHQWAKFPDLAPYCMASVDSVAERASAKALGYRTFRIRAVAEERLHGEVKCPASAEGGHKLHCADCVACSGTTSGRRGDIVIQVHGSSAMVKAFNQRAA